MIKQILFILALLPAARLLAAPTSRPTVAIDFKSCVTAECHGDVKATPFLHGPVGADTCDACHELTDAAAHTFAAPRDGAEMCTYCHEFDVSAMPVIHEPVKKGQCLGCHDPHGGRDRTLTRERSMTDLCGRCHESVTSSHKFLHTPVSKGQCDSCHPPHAAMFPKLVDAVGSDLCLACHTEFDTKLANVRFRHKAMDEGCLKCHDVHGSNEPMQVTKSTVELCESCHEKVKNDILAVQFKHSVVTKDKACLTCHTAHGADAVKLMLDQPVKVCMTCHKDPIKLDKTHTIPAVTELADGAMHRHGAIKDGQCSGCHAAHGSNQPVLLTKVYSRTIYQPFSTASYELCFSCHDVRLVQDKLTMNMTAFRNGDRNLHWAHVKEGQLGRACAVCHTTHASVNERNIRQTTPYKVWNMPLKFERTETGGSCAPGCHVPWAYDRETPVKGPTSAPAIRPAPAIARAAIDEPVMITLSAKDLSGAEVKAPDPARPSVLLLLSVEQCRDEKLIKAIDTAIQKPERAQVIVILCGPQADAKPALRWPIVADPDGKLAAALQVHGWPTALVLQSDGLQIARVGGAIESMSLKLSPYIDVAAKTLDRAVVDAQLSKPKLVTDGALLFPSRELQTASKLIDNGDAKEAQKLLTEALKKEPNSPALRIAMARALIAQDRWTDARVLLSDVLQRSPDSSEAHRLLATIHEHEGNWQQAAAEYRAASGERGK